MHLSSSAFQDGKPIPTKYAFSGVIGGKNISIPLSWTDVPSGTKSFALSMVDPHPVAHNWVHWCVIDIPQTTRLFQEGASGKTMPTQSKELYNSYGISGYGGPEPPKGSGRHPYVFTLYALNIDHLELSLNATLSGFLKAVEGNVLEAVTLTGFYER